jgi:hypothetical protein
MPAQRFRPWKPLDEIPLHLCLEAVHDDYEGLRFLLRGDDPTGATLRLTFESPVGYRNINESYRAKTWASGAEMTSLPSLLIVENSEWLDWLVHEAGGVLTAEKLLHYAIYTGEDCIDVVTEFAPTAEWLRQF